VPVDVAALEDEQIATFNADGRRAGGDLVVDPVGAECEGVVVEVPAEAASRDAFAAADGDERDDRSGRRVDHLAAVNAKREELVVQKAHAGAATVLEEERQVRERVVGAAAAGSEDVDSRGATRDAEIERFLKVCAIGVAVDDQAPGAERIPDCIRDGIEVAGREVDGDAGAAGDIGATVCADDERGSGGAVAQEATRGRFAVGDDERLHREDGTRDQGMGPTAAGTIAG